MVLRIFRGGICRPSKLRRLHNETPLLTRGFCKSEWMKPKYVNRPYSERQELPLIVQATRGHDNVLYGELGVSHNQEHELYKIFARNGNVHTIFASLGLCDSGNTEDIKTGKDGKSKRHEVEAILQTYSELKAFTAPHVKNSGNLVEIESAIEAATLNATTAKADEGEKLTQKLETIGEVPLVEADPDIIKPPKTFGPSVMNMETCELDAKHSDFQIGEDQNELEFVYSQEIETEATPNHIKNYFESNKEEVSSRKPEIHEMVTLNAVPEINADEDLSLTELMERVRQRNRLLRCRDIDQQLNTTSTTMDDQNRPHPGHNVPTIQPGWGWPSQQPRYNQPTPYPYVANPSPQKAEPITPDNRPGYNRATKVNPINLALHLGPLVAAFKNASIMFPLLLMGCLLPKTEFSAGSVELHRNFYCVPSSIFERELEDRPSDIVEARD